MLAGSEKKIIELVCSGALAQAAQDFTVALNRTSHELRRGGPPRRRAGTFRYRASATRRVHGGSPARTGLCGQTIAAADRAARTRRGVGSELEHTIFCDPGGSESVLPAADEGGSAETQGPRGRGVSGKVACDSSGNATGSPFAAMGTSADFQGSGAGAVRTWSGRRYYCRRSCRRHRARSAVVCSIRKAVQLVNAVLQGSRTAVSRLDAKPVVGLFGIGAGSAARATLSRG